MARPEPGKVVREMATEWRTALARADGAVSRRLRAVEDLMSQDIRLQEDVNEVLVFVYGRMKQGGADHAILAGSRFLGQALTAPLYDLIDLGGLPGLTTEGGTAVHGELYAVDERTLTSLDEFEDHPDTFHRDNLILEDGREVLGYILPSTQALGFPRFSSGAGNEALAG